MVGDFAYGISKRPMYSDFGRAPIRVSSLDTVCQNTDGIRITAIYVAYYTRINSYFSKVRTSLCCY